jgi:hypothetical protein
MYYNFKTSKWVKLGVLLENPERKPKRDSLATARMQNKNQKQKQLGLPPAKRFLYSHIARLCLLVSSGMEIMW